ncbi:hypothetical protein ACFPU1_04295 [Thalassorhabdus alkalitolerans]|uniref:Uncharacterized protein n=1 Tax=Thalassorhabdus alkalitolerans TaxID=2282697 RepID=A0ABW0YND1_9BACI|nr:MULTISPECIES: hypothetical protein [Bacillaceae]
MSKPLRCRLGFHKYEFIEWNEFVTKPDNDPGTVVNQKESGKYECELCGKRKDVLTPVGKPKEEKRKI